MLMNKLLKRSIGHIFVGFVIAILLYAPDFIIKAITPSCRTSLNILFFGQVFSLSLLLTFIKSRISFCIILIVVFAAELIQLCHVVYLGVPLSPLSVYKIVADAGEITETGWADFKQVYFVFLTLISCYGLIVYTFFKFYRFLYHVPYLVPVIIMTLLANRCYMSTKRPIESYYPSPVRHSIHNSLNAFTFYFFGGLKEKNAPKISYKSYKAQKKGDAVVQNIILIVGESMRYDHMSLFGYQRPTTPFLDSLKSRPEFIYKKSISSGTCTSVAHPAFMNMMREPGHLSLIDEKTVNLLKLAKSQGFKTVWISAQESKLLYRIGDQYLDVFITSDSGYTLQFTKKGDEAILDLVKNVPLENKNFIILHLRNLHSPYQKNYRHKGTAFDFYPLIGDRLTSTNNAYDNAMHYYDFVMSQIIQHFEKAFQNKGPSCIVFTADHGELLGEEGGLYTHNQLHPHVYTIPFWLLGLNEGIPKQALEKITPLSPISHYEIGYFIADLLGHDIQNPNIEKDVFYVHGDNIDRNYDFIRYKRIDKDQIVADPVKSLDRYVQERKASNHD